MSGRGEEKGSKRAPSDAGAAAGYFRLNPSHVAAYWVALDNTDAANGCMHVVPRSHVDGTPAHDPTVRAADLAVCQGRCVAVPLRAGDALLFHGDLIHGTPPNRSQSRRRAIQVHYASSHCRPTSCGDGARAAALGLPVRPPPRPGWAGPGWAGTRFL